MSCNIVIANNVHGIQDICCPTTTCGHDNSVELTTYDSQRNVYETAMIPLMENAELGSIQLDHGTFEFYKFGKIHQPLKNVFEIMQGWCHYVEELAKRKVKDLAARKSFIEETRYFELNIGGADYVFGIKLTSDTKDIVIVDKTGKAPTYKELFKSFENFRNNNGEMTKLASEILKAARSPVDSQPNWDENLKLEGKILPANLTDNMRTFSVISQVAEGAMPCDKFKKAIQDGHTSYTNKLKERIEKGNFNKVFKHYMLETDEAELGYNRFLKVFPLLDAYDSASKEERKVIVEEFIKVEPFRHNKRFFDELIKIKGNNWDGLTNFLKRCGYEEINEEDLEKLKAFIATDISADTMKTIDEELENFPDQFKQKVFNKFHGLFSEMNNELKTIYNDQKKNMHGRMPGAGTLIRSLLQEMENSQRNLKKLRSS